MRNKTGLRAGFAIGWPKALTPQGEATTSSFRVIAAHTY